ncbi:MAG: hypothetical protein NT059_07365 [Planctomycetota bacterium]|nr:hypothetical protein [Planctomycetota bacterium]
MKCARQAAKAAAAAWIAFTTQTASAQTCASPLPASLGDTAISTTAGNHVNLTGICDVSAIGTDIIYNATWVRFVAPASGTYIARTCGSVAFDSKIAVFTNCANLASVIACNDDTAGCTITTGQAWASKVSFPALAGTAYYIAIGGFGSTTTGVGSVNISSDGSTDTGGGTCATAITAVAGLNAFNTLASSENVNLAGLCDPGSAGDDILHRVRWFTYLATTSGNLELSTCGLAAFDTRIAVFSSCSTVNVIACNDDSNGCPNFTSKLQFAATAGITYKIAVGGFDVTSAGTGQLLITPNAPPPPACGTSTNSCCVAGTTPFCSDSACCSLVCNEDPYCCSTDGSWDATCALRASLLCGACGAGTCTLPASNVTEIEPCGSDLNGGCNSNGAPVQTISVGARVRGTYWADGDARDTDWYQFTVATGSTISLQLYSKGPGRVFLLDSICSPTVLASSNPDAATCPGTATACVAAGTYRLLVATTVFSGFPCSDSVNRDYVLVLNATPCDATPPSNDECVTAQAVPANGAVLTFDTRLATNSPQPMDPLCDEGTGTGITRDVWYSWTPSVGVARVSTCGTASFDTRLAAYDSCDGLTLACNDDYAGCNGFTSRIDVLSDGHTPMRIRLGGYDSTGTGTVTFSVIPQPVNDNCAGAITITNGGTTFNTDAATDSDPPLDPLCDEGYGLPFVKDVWYRYVATCSGQAVVSTCTSATFDTRLAAYTSCGGTLIACNDDSTGCTGLTSRMTMTVTSGTAYLIRVGGHSTAGSGTLNVSCGAGGGGGTPNDTCATATIAHPGANAFDNTLAVSNPPTAPSGGCLGDGFFNDVWFSYTPAFNGSVSISTCAGASFDTRLELWSGCPGLSGSTVIACNDDYCGNLSAITASLTCGGTYWIRIGSWGSAGFGSGTLTLVEAAVPCTSPCPADLNHDGVVGGADLGILLGNWAGSGVGDLDNSGIINGADLGLLLGLWGTCAG